MNDQTPMITLSINNQSITVPKGTTVLQACQQLDIEVPVFCYHPKLAVAGNCRMCLVQMGSSPKPVASCAMPACEGMEIHTNTPMVENARRGVLEFLLINHPLDCPICDQGGECDLQDITLAYGAGESRYTEPKRIVDNPPLGPLIKTIMNRCIHCMRCVRFGNDIAGVPELGSLGRGEDTEVMTVVGQTVASELSGNMIDICPVGALTAKPYAFEGRPWEFEHTVCIDVHDAIGSNLRVDTREGRVMRIVPEPNEAVNEEWITDKARFTYDALRLQRLDKAYVRQKEAGLGPCSAEKALEHVAGLLRDVDPSKITMVMGPMVDLETLSAFKQLAAGLKIMQICSAPESVWVPKNGPGDWCLNMPLAQIEQADVCLLVGANPRYEGPLLNARLRKGIVRKTLRVGVLGKAIDLTYDYDHLGDDLTLLNGLENLDHGFIQALKSAKRPLILVSGAIEQSPEAEAIFQQVQRLSELFSGADPDWQIFQYLPLTASRVGALDLGMHTLEGRALQEKLTAGEIEVLINVGCDELDFEQWPTVKKIYFGSHGEAGASAADVIFPTPAFHEKEGHFVNAEGRMQKSCQAVCPLGDAKPEWRWAAEIGQMLDVKMSADLSEIQDNLWLAYSSLRLGQAPPRRVSKLKGPAARVPEGTKVESPITNFYQTNVISRLSPLMAACTQNKRDTMLSAAEERV